MYLKDFPLINNMIYEIICITEKNAIATITYICLYNLHVLSFKFTNLMKILCIVKLQLVMFYQ